MTRIKYNEAEHGFHTLRVTWLAYKLSRGQNHYWPVTVDLAIGLLYGK